MLYIWHNEANKETAEFLKVELANRLNTEVRAGGIPPKDYAGDLLFWGGAPSEEFQWKARKFGRIFNDPRVHKLTSDELRANYYAATALVIGRLIRIRTAEKATTTFALARTEVNKRNFSQFGKLLFPGVPPAELAMMKNMLDSDNWAINPAKNPKLYFSLSTTTVGPPPAAAVEPDVYALDGLESKLLLSPSLLNIETETVEKILTAMVRMFAVKKVPAKVKLAEIVAAADEEEAEGIMEALVAFKSKRKTSSVGA